MIINAMLSRFTFSICVMYDFISEKDTMRQLKGGKVKGIYCKIYHEKVAVDR